MAVAKGGKVLGLNKWAWAGVAAFGVIIFLYFRHAAATKAADTGNAPQATDSPVDTAALGGTQPTTDSGAIYPADDSALLADLFNLFEQSLMQYGQSFPALTGSGVYGGDSGGSIPAVPAAGGNSAGAAAASALATQTSGGITPSYDYSPPPPATTVYAGQTASGSQVFQSYDYGLPIDPGFVSLTTIDQPGPGPTQSAMPYGGLGLATGPAIQTSPNMLKPTAGNPVAT